MKERQTGGDEHSTACALLYTAVLHTRILNLRWVPDTYQIRLDDLTLASV